MSKLILIHSSGLGPSQWERYLSDFEQWHPVAPTLLGYEDDGKAGEWSTFTIDDDVAVIKSAMDDDHNILMGHSYGGMVALQTALKYPGRIDGLILFEPVAYGVIRESIEDKNAVEETIKEFLHKGFENPKLWIETFLDYWNGDGAYKKMGAEQKLPFLRNAAKIFAEVQFLMADLTPAEAYAALDMPVLIIMGERTQMEMGYLCSRLAQVMPQAELISIEEAGHMVPVTHFGKIAHHLFQFFDRL